LKECLQLLPFIYSEALDKSFYMWLAGRCKKRRDNGTDDRTPGGRYATGHCPVLFYVRRTHDGAVMLEAFLVATGVSSSVIERSELLWHFVT